MLNWIPKIKFLNWFFLPGYLLTLVIAAVFLLLGDLNKIAPYISNFYLASFFIVNITCFHSDWVKLPNFRPSFRYYNKWISLSTGIICFILMFLLVRFVAFLPLLFLLILIYFFRITFRPSFPFVWCWWSTTLSKRNRPKWTGARRRRLASSIWLIRAHSNGTIQVIISKITGQESSV